MEINLFLIECDPGNSLGGSCIRDLYNTANHMNYSNIYVFTTNKPDKKKFPIHSEFFILNILNLKKCMSKIKNKSTIIVLISGHGYQMKDREGDELDGMDEYIKDKQEIIKDDQLREIFICPLINKSQINFIGLVDTCHSGTMFDLDYSYNGQRWLKDTNRAAINVDAISLSACRDNQLDNCDIGNIGYGGALTVHLLDNNFLKDIINKKHIEVYNKLKIIFKKLGQTPILQKCSKV